MAQRAGGAPAGLHHDPRRGHRRQQRGRLHHRHEQPPARRDGARRQRQRLERDAADRPRPRLRRPRRRRRAGRRRAAAASDARSRPLARARSDSTSRRTRRGHNHGQQDLRHRHPDAHGRRAAHRQPVRARSRSSASRRSPTTTCRPSPPATARAATRCTSSTTAAASWRSSPYDPQRAACTLETVADVADALPRRRRQPATTTRRSRSRSSHGVRALTSRASRRTGSSEVSRASTHRTARRARPRRAACSTAPTPSTSPRVGGDDVYDLFYWANKIRIRFDGPRREVLRHRRRQGRRVQRGLQVLRPVRAPRRPGEGAVAAHRRAGARQRLARGRGRRRQLRHRQLRPRPDAARAGGLAQADHDEDRDGGQDPRVRDARRADAGDGEVPLRLRHPPDQPQHRDHRAALPEHRLDPPVRRAHQHAARSPRRPACRCAAAGSSAWARSGTTGST